MYKLLRKFNVGRRLTLSFALMIVLSALIAVTGLLALNALQAEVKRLSEVSMERVLLTSVMTESNAALEVALRNILLYRDDEHHRVQLASIAEARSRYSAAREALAQLPNDAQITAMLVEIDLGRKHAAALNNRVIELANAGKEADARDLLLGEASTVMQQWAAKVTAFEDYAHRMSDEQSIAAQQVARLGSGVIIGGSVLALLISVLLAAAITRSLTRPLSELNHVARAMAEGDFDQQFNTQGRDEAAQLLQAMAAMQGQLKRFSDELKTLIHLHYAENPTHRMPEDFPGDYGVLAKGVNTVVMEHVEAILGAIEVMSEYGRGDFRRDVRRLPGKRAVLHESVDAIKANLLATSGEIQRLAIAASNGDFSLRGDESRFEAAFRDMVVSLNRLMSQADDGLSDVGRMLRALAEGDLTQSIDRQYEGAFGVLAHDANQTAAQLVEMMAGIQDAAETISTAAAEIAAGNTDLSSRTESQAASLEEAASSMEELTSTVRQNADNAVEADRQAQGAGSIAENGGQVVREVVSTMHRISESSRRIGDIIGVIDSIAFQTNILALNAAVEAARAGEQGRGFAVVATEVRSLAQRSAAAATEIKTLIASSGSAVKEGAQQVERAGQTMDEIVTAVRSVTSLMSDITEASREQRSGIEQVGLTVTQLDQVTQQNAALVEQASASARSLADQAASMAQAVARFRLPGAAGRGGAKRGGHGPATHGGVGSARPAVAAAGGSAWTAF